MKNLETQRSLFQKKNTFTILKSLKTKQDVAP
jgi:hypothetical protein